MTTKIAGKGLLLVLVLVFHTLLIQEVKMSSESVMFHLTQKLFVQ